MKTAKMNKVILPELGEGIEKATIACWHCKVGDQVKQDDDIVEVVTDKATFNVSSDSAGIMREIFIQEGQEARIGEVLAIVEPMATKR